MGTTVRAGAVCAPQQVSSPTSRVYRTEGRVRRIDQRPRPAFNGATMCEKRLRVQLSYIRPAVPLVRVEGHLDDVTAADLRGDLDGQLDASPWAVILDLTAVSAIQPDAVPVLVDVARRAGSTDVGLYIVSADSALAQMLARDGIADLFDIHDTVDSARRTLSGRS